MTLLVDFNQVGNATYFANQMAINSPNFWRFLMIKSLKKLESQFKPDEIILAVDSHSWRKDEFPNYKCKRAEKRDEGYGEFLTELNNFQGELKENFPYKLIKLEGAEGDDVIATLAQTIEGDIVIISSDKDFVQLHNERITQYDPIRDKSVVYEIGKSKYYLMLKGDDKDSIPNIRSHDDVFKIGERQKNFPDKEIFGIIEAGDVEGWVKNQNETIQKNFTRNKKLVDLSIENIPQNIVEGIKTIYNTQVVVKDEAKIINYFKERQMYSLTGEVKADDIQEFVPVTDSLGDIFN